MGSTRTVALWGRFQPGFSKKRMKREAAKKKEAEGEGVTRCDCHCRSVVSSINPSINQSHKFGHKAFCIQLYAA